jgi:hypothetical protein
LLGTGLKCGLGIRNFAVCAAVSGVFWRAAGAGVGGCRAVSPAGTCRLYRRCRGAPLLLPVWAEVLVRGRKIKMPPVCGLLRRWKKSTAPIMNVRFLCAPMFKLTQ